MKKATFRQYKSLDRMMDVKVPYSLTLNAEDQHTNYDDRIARMYKYYKKRLSKLHFEYDLHMEISTPCDGREPRVHLHGVMYFGNYQQLRKWYEKDNNDLAKSMNIDIDTIHDGTEWCTYAQKNNVIMSKITDSYRLKSIGYTSEYINKIDPQSP